MKRAEWLPLRRVVVLVSAVRRVWLRKVFSVRTKRGKCAVELPPFSITLYHIFSYIHLFISYCPVLSGIVCRSSGIPGHSSKGGTTRRKHHAIYGGGAEHLSHGSQSES